MDEQDLKNFATFLMHGFLEFKREMKRQKVEKKQEEQAHRAWLRQIQESESSYSSGIQKSIWSDGALQLTLENRSNARLTHLLNNKNQLHKLHEQRKEKQNVDASKNQKDPAQNLVDDKE